MKVVLSEEFLAFKAKYDNISDEEYYKNESYHSMSVAIIKKTLSRFSNGPRKVIGLRASAFKGKFFAILEDESQVPMDFITPAEDFTTTW
jgi:hypothetical protein